MRSTSLTLLLVGKKYGSGILPVQSRKEGHFLLLPGITPIGQGPVALVQ